MTMTSGQTRDQRSGAEAEEYLDAVAAHLGHLAPDDRADLLEDLAQHLHEVVAEGGPPLVERLGPAERFAAELLASAGLGNRPSPSRGLRGRLVRLRSAAEGTAKSRVWSETVDVARTLRPAWWAARAYLAVSLVSELLPAGGGGFPLPRLAGSAVLGAGAILAAVWASVRLARSESRLRALHRRGLLAAHVVLVGYAVVLLGNVGPEGPEPVFWTVDSGPTDTCLRDGSGSRITNLYPYDTEGNLLSEVLIFDDVGRPIDNLCPEHDRSGRPLRTAYARDLNGADVYHVFPRAQTVEGWGQPRAQGFTPPAGTAVRPPAVVIPRLAQDTAAEAAPSTADAAPPP